MNEIVKKLQQSIDSLGTVKKAKWLENYVKHDIQSRGTSIPQLRKLLQQTVKEYQITEKDLSDQLEFLNQLMSSNFTEDKLSAILYLQLYWCKQKEKVQLDLITDWFDNGWIYDWNVCDWLCVRVVTPLLDSIDTIVIPILKVWNTSSIVWKARASLVSIAQCQNITKYQQEIVAFSTCLIQRQERFCKTAVGWMLREYSKHDIQWVQEFLNTHEQHVTTEVTKNALRYMSSSSSSSSKKKKKKTTTGHQAAAKKRRTTK